MAYVKKLDSLIVYCQFPLEEGKILKIDLASEKPVSMPNPYSSNKEDSFSLTPSPMHTNTTTIFKAFQGAPIRYKTIKITKFSDHIYLNHKSDTIKILTNYDKNGYSALIPIFLKKRKLVDFQPYRANKVITLTKDNILQVFKFQTFGHFEKITEFSSFEKNLNFGNLVVCPKHRYIILSQISECEENGKTAFEKIIFMKMEKKNNITKSTSGYKLEIIKLFETSFNFKKSDMAILTLPFYWQKKPVLGVFEREGGDIQEEGELIEKSNEKKITKMKKNPRNRLYFYSFSEKKCEVIKNLVFPWLKDMIGYGVGGDCLIQVGVDGEILRIGVE